MNSTTGFNMTDAKNKLFSFGETNKIPEMSRKFFFFLQQKLLQSHSKVVSHTTIDIVK